MRLLIGLAALAVPADADSGPRFSNVFADHMVLQQNKPIKVWGFGASSSGSPVSLSVSLGSATTSAVAMPDGRWHATLPARPGASCSKGGLELQLKSSTGAAVQILEDICVGEVYLFSGQSNIDTIVTKHAFNASAEIAAASGFPHVRIADTAHEDTKQAAFTLAAHGVSSQQVEWEV